MAIVTALAAGAPVTTAAGQAPAGPLAAKLAVPADAALALDPGEGRAVASKLADGLVSSFVNRDQAEAYAAMLRKNALPAATTRAHAERSPR